MDVYMPGCTGIELAAVIRQQSAYLGIPIVYLSAETNLRKQLLALRLGDDFLTKPIRPEYLISAVMSRVQRFRALRSLMLRDSLTGLLNHTAFEEYIGREIARVRRQGTPLAVALIDLDHFKTVNDTYGHPTGDRVLKSVARVLQQRLRRTDVIGRYGGEEFAVLFPNTIGRQAQRVVDEVRTTFAQVRHQSDSKEFHVTFSGGVATCPPYNEAARLTEAADQALYAAKEAGRNCVVLADQ
jgi:diguanylate cyclase (GGDEF)-like protein